MDRATLATRARKHWSAWLPEKTRMLKEAGEFNQAIQSAALKAQQEIAHLVAQGYNAHEAEEVALLLFILLKPEPKERDLEAEELAKMERQFQKVMAAFLED